jgi:hypothetical protein
VWNTLCSDLGTVDELVNLLIAIVIIYVGFAILYPINPFLTIIFVLAALYILTRAIGRGRL